MTALRTLLWALTAFATAWIGLAQSGLADQRTEGSGIYAAAGMTSNCLRNYWDSYVFYPGG